MPTHVDADARIRLDTPSLEARAELYPEALRPSFLWLGAFVREECHRDIDVLVERVLKVDAKRKFKIDKTNWSKILRGRWNRNAADEVMDHPVVALARLL